MRNSRFKYASTVRDRNAIHCICFHFGSIHVRHSIDCEPPSRVNSAAWYWENIVPICLQTHTPKFTMGECKLVKYSFDFPSHIDMSACVFQVM